MTRKTKKQVSDERQLEMFVARVRELVDTRLFRERQLHNYNASINWNISDGVSVKAQEPDEDDLRSFLLTFRQFVMNDEPIQFYKIYNTAYNRLKPPFHDKREFLAKARAEWQKAETGLEAFIVDREHLKADYVLDLYINGRYFHNDPDHADKLKELEKYPVRLDKMRFLMSLQDFTHIIVQVGNFVGYGLNNGWFDV